MLGAPAALGLQEGPRLALRMRQHQRGQGTHCCISPSPGAPGWSPSTTMGRPSYVCRFSQNLPINIPVLLQLCAWAFLSLFHQLTTEKLLRLVCNMAPSLQRHQQKWFPASPGDRHWHWQQLPRQARSSQRPHGIWRGV